MTVDIQGEVEKVDGAQLALQSSYPSPSQVELLGFQLIIRSYLYILKISPSSVLDFAVISRAGVLLALNSLICY